MGKIRGRDAHKEKRKDCEIQTQIISAGLTPKPVIESESLGNIPGNGSKGREVRSATFRRKIARFEYSPRT
jgi:hypothetical protein